MGNLPLRHIRVLDLGSAISGPVTGQTLCDLGAEVIYIEPFHGDIQRGAHRTDTPPAGNPAIGHPYNKRPFFNDLHRGKLGVTLDLSTEAGASTFRSLVRVSDVVVENFSPRVMRNLGLEYAELKKERQDIIMVSISGFGKSGPYRVRASYGPGIVASSGVASLTGYPDGEPLKPGNFFPDISSGLHAAFAVLAALTHRRETGQGQHIDLAMREVETSIIGEAFIDFQMNGRKQSRIGNRHQWMAPHGCYRCKGEDRWVTITVETDDEWRRFVGALGNPAWAEEPRFSNSMARYAHQGELDKFVEQWTSERSHYEVMHILQKAGVASGAVLDVREALDDPHMKDREVYTHVMHPEMLDTVVRRPLWRLSKTPLNVHEPSPCFAQHNDHVFGELLGKGQEEVSRLYEEDVTTRLLRP